MPPEYELWPVGLPTIELQTVGINGIETADILSILSSDGFFHLDITKDQEYLQLSNKLHAVAVDVFNNVPIEDKEMYQGDPLKGLFDKGYRVMGKDSEGVPRVAELTNVPLSVQELPPWLEPYRQTHGQFAQKGQIIAEMIIANLDRALNLSGRLIETHSNTESGFVRMFKYPAGGPLVPGTAHTDGNSVTMLFNWLGGLQIARTTSVQMVDNDDGNDEWLWVKPVPGHLIVNLGDPMVILTNGVLKSGRHRVVRPPEDQAKKHRYSLLTGIRPRSDTLSSH